MADEREGERGFSGVCVEREGGEGDGWMKEECCTNALAFREEEEEEEEEEEREEREEGAD